MATKTKTTRRRKTTGIKTKPKSKTSPGAGSRRPLKEQTGGTVRKYTALGYRSVRVMGRDGRRATAASGEAHQEYDRSQLINQSRKFMNDNSLYKGMIERFVSYLVGSGFTLIPMTKNKKTNLKISKLWKEFWDDSSPETRELLSGLQVEKMIARELGAIGDTGILKVAGGTVQLIEAEQIVGTKNTSVDGIVKEENGKPKKYMIASWQNRSAPDGKKAISVDPKDFIFLTDPDRPSAFRTVPPLQPSFPNIHRINDVCDSEAAAWQLLSRIALSITREEAEHKGFNESKPDPTRTEDGQPANRIEQFDHSIIFHGNPGEEIRGVERNIPGKNFSESMRMFIRLGGLPLGLPLELILLDWTQSNYSQSKAVTEQAFQTFQQWQKLVAFAKSNIFRWKIILWINEGKLPSTLDIFDHKWDMPNFPWLDQLKEAQAWGEKVDRSFSTHDSACQSQNTSRQDVVEIREQEIRDAIDRSDKIFKEKRVRVPWQTFCGMEIPKETISIPTEQNKKNPGGE